jgi:hypothetical protein
MQIGSRDHRDLFCETFVGSHLPYDPAEIAWPDLDDATLRTLRGIPVWTEALNTEAEATAKVRSLAVVEPDPVVAEALDMQADEEQRHARLLEIVTAHYDIDTESRGVSTSRRPAWNFLTLGFAECFDSFFAFGVFRLAQDSGKFHPTLVKVFDIVMQEEARHILFFENWRAWRRAAEAHRFAWNATSAAAVASQLAARVQLGMREAIGRGGDESAKSDDNFLLDFNVFADVTPRDFLGVCLDEHSRRLEPYDRRLLRPRMAPAIARRARALLPKRRAVRVAT